ncbi:hypothetical protein CHS0354_003287, partial [Potamilus streckersoni]
LEELQETTGQTHEHVPQQQTPPYKSKFDTPIHTFTEESAISANPVRSAASNPFKY